jgi:hypothetical protein
MLPRLALIIAIALTATIGHAETPPDDSAAYHLVVLLRDPPSPACASLESSLASPEVAAIAARTKTFRFTPTNPVYLASFASALPAAAAPTVALVRWDGGVLFKASGSAIPRGPALAAALRSAASADQATAARSAASNLLDRRPGLIPDTVTIQPRLELRAPSTGTIAAIVGIVLLCLFGLAGLAVVGLVAWFYLDRTPIA